MQITSQQPFFLQCIIACFSVIFPWTVREGYFCFPSYFYSVDLFISNFLLSYPIYIRLFIRLFICLTLLAVQLFVILISCYCYLSNPVWYMLFSFLFLLQNLFLLLRFLTPIQPNCCPRLQSGLRRSYYRIMFSVLKYLGLSCCQM